MNENLESEKCAYEIYAHISDIKIRRWLTTTFSILFSSNQKTTV